MLRKVVAPVRGRAIDPRFDRTFGSFNKDLFEKSFGFLADMQKDELQQLRLSLRKERHPGRREGLQRTLQRLVWRRAGTGPLTLWCCCCRPRCTRLGSATSVAKS